MKSPKIRFKEFQNEWNSRILGDIAKRIVRKNSKNETNLPLTISSQFGLIDQKKFFNHQVASKDLSNYYLLYKNEFAYNKSYSNGYDFGSIKRLKFYDKGALSTLYICFSFNDKYNTQFFESYFDTLKWYKDVENICAEGARNHGLLNVLSSDFFTIKTRIPNDIKEQEKIGEFFRKIDGILDLENSRFKKLENFKKTMLDKLFVKDGADEPQIRLGSFKGKWNSRILGEVCNKFDNLRIPIAENLRKKGNIPYYGANGIQDYVDGYTHDGEFVLIAEDGANDIKNYPVQYVNGKIWVNNHAHVLKGKNGILNNIFLNYSI